MWRFFLLEKHKVLFCGLLEKGVCLQIQRKSQRRWNCSMTFFSHFPLSKKLWTDGPTALNAGGSMGDLAFA